MTTIDNVKDFYNQIVAEHSEYYNELQKLNALEQQILHYVELESYSASQGSQLLKKLKVLRQRRRIVRQQEEELNVIINRLKRSNILTMKHNNAHVYSVPIESILNAAI